MAWDATSGSPAPCRVSVAKTKQTVPRRSMTDSEDVLARSPPPGLSMHRPARLRPCPAPLLVVHGPPDGAKVPIIEAAYVAVVGHGSHQIALDLARTSCAIEELLLLLRRGFPEIGRVDPGRHEASVNPRLAFGIVNRRRPLGKFAAPSFDPAVVVVVRPPSPVLGLVLRGTARRLL